MHILLDLFYSSILYSLALSLLCANVLFVDSHLCLLFRLIQPRFLGGLVILLSVLVLWFIVPVGKSYMTEFIS